jgi:hypothetical protein
VEQAVNELKAKGADRINGGFPTTGTLQGADGPGFFVVDGSEVKGNLFLTYALQGASFSFHIGLTAWRLSFDTALELLINVPDQPGPLRAIGLSAVKNAKVSPDNFAATVATFAVDTFLPSLNLLGNAENSIDGSKGLPVDQLNTSLNQLTPVFQSALEQGFVHLRAVVDGAGLTLRLIHPIDAAPVVIDEASLPSFHGQVLVVSQSQTRPGGQLVATGTGFTPAHAASLHLKWNDTTSGRISGSDIQLTPSHGTTQNVHLSRLPSDNANNFVASGLVPDTTYEVRVRDCDALTCTDWSAPLTTKTTTSDQVALTLQSATGAVDVGHTTLGLDGTFSLPVNIPAAATAGPYLLHATVGGESAVASLQVIGSNQVAHPLLSVLSSSTGEPSQTQVAGVIEQEKVTVRGEDFPLGLVQLAVETGQPLGAATASASGLFTTTFIWPVNVVGSHKIVASQSVGGTNTIQASAAVFVQPLPR